LPPTPLRRAEDHFWWCRSRFLRRLWPALVLIGGFAWSRALTFYDGIPSQDKIKQYDAGLQLIPEFYKVRADVDAIKTDIAHDRSLSAEQRREILKRIDDLDDKLSRWFEKASSAKQAQR
jgi:hypothetical protein